MIKNKRNNKNKAKDVDTISQKREKIKRKNPNEQRKA
jgi:hypothetical protein